MAVRNAVATTLPDLSLEPYVRLLNLIRQLMDDDELPVPERDPFDEVSDSERGFHTASDDNDDNEYGYGY